MKLAIYCSSLIFAIVLVSCANNPSSASQTGPANTGTAVPQENPSPNVAIGSATKHYICPNNCVGSGGDQAGNCPVCGSQYLHNQAFHNQGTTSNSAAGGPNPLFQNPANAPQIPAASQTPVQNASGVYHYICSNGCAGGSGSATACSNCGSTLVHNAAYHNN